jgi:preprotein translocase subunit SecG
LIFIVLLQSGKGAQIGAAFGGSSQTLFGSRGSVTILSKLTTISAIVFMLTSFALTYFSSVQRKTSLPEGTVQKSTETPPPVAQQPQPPALPLETKEGTQESVPREDVKKDNKTPEPLKKEQTE